MNQSEVDDISASRLQRLLNNQAYVLDLSINILFFLVEPVEARCSGGASYQINKRGIKMSAQFCSGVK
jgi:hypothetical protein